MLHTLGMFLLALIYIRIQLKSINSKITLLQNSNSFPKKQINTTSFCISSKLSKIDPNSTYFIEYHKLMTSPQNRLFFPSFTDPKSKQSPSKKLLSKVQGGIGSLTGEMKDFLQSKVAKGIKLNNLNQVNSVHSSVYQQNSVNKSQQNSLRNMVNSSYWNSTQQSIKHNYGDDRVNVKSSQNNKQMMKRTKPKDKRLLKDQQSYLDRQKLINIRSRSSSNLSSNISDSIQSPLKNKIFSLTEQIRPIHNNKPISHQVLSFLEDQMAKKQTEIKTSNLPVQEQVEKLFTENYGRNFIKNLIDYMNKDWAKEEGSLLEDRKIQMLINIITSKFGCFTELAGDFLASEFAIDYSTPVQLTSNYTLRQIKLISSILLKQSQKTVQQMKKLFEELIAKLPQQGIVEQQFILDELKKSLLQIYDPKFTYSSTKMKQRFKLYYEVYCTKRNSLQTEIKHKLKPQLNFIKEMENYLSAYQKELIKLKGQISNLQKQKQHLMDLLKQKTTFKPIQIDFEKLALLKQQAKQTIKKDFDQNVVVFHNKLHQKDAQTIKTLQDQNKRMKKQVQAKQKQRQYHLNKLEDYLNSIPTKRDASTQIFNIPTSMTKVQKSAQTSTFISPHQLGIYPNFLANIITPFTFNQKITSSLISILTIDKILYDFEPIKSKTPLMPFKHYIFEWFIIRIGSKKIAQIFLKNFLYSIKKYRNKHKRFSIFNKICGFLPARGKNLQEDIEHLFYQTNLAWYYIVRLALVYRKKLNQNTTGYHIFPPINCEQIFKLSLRKAYELIEEFFIEQGIQVPQNLTQKIDHYAINQISKFKQHDQDWQKQSLQQIHILREMNFDIIAGFVIDYIASQRAIVLEGLLRSIHLKQEEEKTHIGYAQFETIYRKFYKQKRSKIQFIYSKVCLCNMSDILNASNMMPAILHCIQDQFQLRSIFDKDQTLKALVVSQKQIIALQTKSDKKTYQNMNQFQHFKEKFYNEFYDFYDMTNMLQEIFRIIKGLIKKKLKKLSRQEKYIQTMLDIPKRQTVGQIKTLEVNKKQKDMNSDDSDEEENDQTSSQEQQPKLKTDPSTLQKLTGERTLLQQKLQEWKKIQQRIPHFATKILTIEQIIIHNMRKMQMLEGCEYAWRSLRDLLVLISK